jgi:predicted ATPase/DNA-binding NarL/FixJ family response regulator/Tfp pilus assembly protein PilF
MVRSPSTSLAHHNLPAPGTPLVGRDKDVARLCRLVLQPDRRLVTLTGVGGSGKTRLALRVASQLVGSFKDGVWLVTLAPVADPVLVPSAVASALGMHEQPDRSLLDGLVAHLSRRQVLLVLDNCEHLVEACAELAAALLQACPNLRMLATSREPLQIADEVAWRVPPLAFPDSPTSLADLDLGTYSAVQLFVERAVAAQSTFALTPNAAPVVATICARLDGIPLAIELAAAWVRALGLNEILERLDNMFGLLVGGSRVAPNRLRTMRAALDWSYGLLAPSERVVLQRLAVFVGGWSLEAMEAICSGSGVAPPEVLALLTRLVDVSLVQVEERDERARYRLLEPVRQFAHAQLVESGELEVVRRQHATFFLSYAEQRLTDANMGGPGRQAAHAAIDQEHDNLRAALGWCLDQGEAEMGLRFSRAHWSFWVLRGHFREGRAWLVRLVALLDAEKAPGMRAVALTFLGGLSWRQGSHAVAQALYAEALPLLRQSGDSWVLASAFTGLGFVALDQTDYRGAQAYFEEALPLWRATGDQANVAICLSNLGWAACQQEAYAVARARCEDSLALARAVGDTWAVSQSLTILGYALLGHGDLAAARPVLDESVDLGRQLGERRVLALSLDALGRVATAEGQYTEAQAALRESLQIRHQPQVGDGARIPEILESIAALVAAEAQPERAMQLAGAAAGVREAIGVEASPMDRARLDHCLGRLRQALGPEASTRAWETGRATPLERAVEMALAVTQPSAPRRTRPPASSLELVTILSPREQQVAALLARNLSNRQIAGQLVITERTVAAHIEHILDKLGFASRHQVSAWATERGLLS